MCIPNNLKVDLVRSCRIKLIHMGTHSCDQHNLLPVSGTTTPKDEQNPNNKITHTLTTKCIKLEASFPRLP